MGSLMGGGGSGCWLRLLGSEARRKRNRNRQLAKWRARMTNDKGTNDKAKPKSEKAPARTHGVNGRFEDAFEMQS